MAIIEHRHLMDISQPHQPTFTVELTPFRSDGKSRDGFWARDLITGIEAHGTTEEEAANACWAKVFPGKDLPLDDPAGVRVGRIA